MSAGARLISRVAGLAVVLVVAAVVYPNLVNRAPKTKRVVHVVVSFLAVQRSGTEQVVATLTVGGQSKGTEHLTRSPRTWSLYPPVGHTVVVDAAQTAGQALGCAITQDGTPGVFRATPGPGAGAVLCSHITQ